MKPTRPFGLFTRVVGGAIRPATDEEIIAAARQALDAKFARQGHIADLAGAKDFLSLRLGDLPHEVFAVLFLDSQHHVIEFQEMFRGTLTQTSVYPREVVKEALRLNAACLILAHFVARHKMRLLCPESFCSHCRLVH